MRLSRCRIPVALGALAATVASMVVMAQATTTTCNVAASGGYANCLAYASPSLFEQVKAPNASGTPYRFQLYRFSDGARWGWWQWSDTNYHTVFLSLSGTITAQVDNLGSGTQGYTVTME